MAVDRCVCLDVSLRRIVALRDEHVWGFEEVRRHTGCSTGCRMCEPYVRLALATGRTSFPVLTDGQVREAMRLDAPAQRAVCADQTV
jgi:bacterioferritin-associated ferredoxin